MDFISKENTIGLTSNLPAIKRVNQPIQKAAGNTKKALADVSNTFHKSKKNTQDFLKANEPSKKIESVKNFEIYVEEKNVINSPAPKKTCSERIPLSPISGITVKPNLSPSYFYESEDEDPHNFCHDHALNDDFDNLLPPTLRLNNDDIDSLAKFKPSEEHKSWLWNDNLASMTDESEFNDFNYKPAEEHKPWLWNDNLSLINDDLDLDDFNVPFPSPEKYSDFEMPFNKFFVPGILDDSF